MPRRWPQKVGGSTAGDVAMVMAISWGHEDVEEWALGALGVGGALVWSVPRSRGRNSA
jgi:ABC-type cobalamin transport system permease subunit